MEIDRLQAFSDGVFAIIITILVLELHVPPHETGALLAAVMKQWPTFVAFLVSFAYVGTLWLYHHDFFATLRQTDVRLNVYNLVILCTTALICYPTALLSESVAHGNVDDIRVATIVYALVAGAVSLSFAPLYPYLVRHPALVEPEVPGAFFQASQRGPYLSVAIYLLAIAFSFWNVYAGIAGVVAGIVFHIFAYARMQGVLSKYRGV